MEPERQISTRLPFPMADQLEALAKAGDRSIAGEARRAIRAWLDQHETPVEERDPEQVAA